MDRRLPSEREEWHKAVPSVDKDHPGLWLLDVLVVGEWLQNLLSVHLRREEYWDSKKFSIVTSSKWMSCGTGFILKGDLCESLRELVDLRRAWPRSSNTFFRGYIHWRAEIFILETRILVMPGPRKGRAVEDIMRAGSLT